MLLTLKLTTPDRNGRKPWWKAHPHLASTILLIAATALAYSVLPYFRPTNLAMLYLIAVLLASVYLGYWPAIIVSSIGTLLFDFLFVPPYFGFTGKDAEYVITFSGLFLTGLVINDLVTKLHARNRQLQSELARVIEAEAKLRLSSQVFENSGEGLMICDAGGCVQAINKTFTTLTGIDESQAIGQPLNQLAALPAPVSWDASLTESRSLRWRGEISGTRPNGEPWIALLSIHAASPNHHSPGYYIATWSDITGRRAAESQMRFLAFYDPLTRLLNRTAIEEEITHAIHVATVDHQGGFSILLIDLDHFKTINDSLGHAQGDRLLQIVAARLRGALRGQDRIGRLGGDEFIVLLNGVADREAVAIVVKKLVAALTATVLLEQHAITLTLSMGVSRYPDDGQEVDTLIKHADAAMYLAKEEGRSAFRFFEAQLGSQAYERFTITTGLRRAIECDELELWYQPQIDGANGRMVGAEALIRWRHPERGLLSPGAFVPIAEENNLIDALGQWVVAEACRQLQSWRASGLSAPPLAINLSPRQLNDPTLDKQIARCIEATGLTPAGIELELTESALAQQDPAFGLLLDALHKRGFGLTVDDFGTGYSSLSYLRRFPFTKLKIDRSFVIDLPQQKQTLEIVRAIIAIAAHLGMEIVAEGVETDEQFHTLLELGCPVFQGYLFSRPVPAEDFARLLQPIVSPSAPLHDTP